MNKAILVGRLTRDPEVRYSQGENATAVARYTLAVERRYKRDGEPSADFINCVVFGKPAEFAEKYFRQGLRVAISGHIQTGSYTNKDGVKVYTTEVVVEEQEFAQSRNEGGSDQAQNNSQPEPQASPTDNGGFMNIADGIEDLQFNEEKRAALSSPFFVSFCLLNECSLWFFTAGRTGACLFLDCNSSLSLYMHSFLQSFSVRMTFQWHTVPLP